jgi:hypothetical protein
MHFAKFRPNTVITFAQCCPLLINTATGYDNRNDKSTSHGKSRRSVFNSETFFGDHDDVTYDDNTTEFDFNVDATPAELLAFAMDRRERPQFKSGSRMPITRWKALSDAAKKIWDQMEDDDKAKILALSETRKPAAQSGSSKFSINSHAATDAPEADLDEVLIAMVTKHSNRSKPHSHPGDIRTVLSQPAMTSKATVQDDEVKVNGHTYVRKAMSHDIQHRVSLASRKKKSSLIDCGANGGIAGADTRIIERHPHRTVDICGIDNHEITSTPIVTAGAVAKSQRGDVILIMHQHACYHQQDESIHSSGQLESFSNDVNDKSISIHATINKTSPFIP